MALPKKKISKKLKKKSNHVFYFKNNLKYKKFNVNVFLNKTKVSYTLSNFLSEII